MSTVKARALIEKEWDPISWDGDIWKDPDEAEDPEPLNSDESSLPVEDSSSPLAEAASPQPVVVALSLTVISTVFPSQSEGINPALTEENVMASSEAVAMHSSADSPQDPPPP